VADHARRAANFATLPDLLQAIKTLRLLQQRIKEEGALLARRSDRISLGVKAGFRRRLLRRSGRRRIGLYELRAR
jgi:hypothetical protein